MVTDFIMKNSSLISGRSKKRITNNHWAFTKHLILIEKRIINNIVI